jgi:hypothetical protein
MTNHEEPAPIHAPDFMQTFDGTQAEVSDLEKMDVAEAFNDYCDDIIANNVSNIGVAEEPFEISRTSVNLVLPEKSGLWDIKVMKESHSAFTPYDTERAIPDASMYLDYYDSDSNTRSGYRYALRNSEVTREDAEDIYLEDMQARTSGNELLEGEALKKWLLEQAVDFDDMQSDEKAMGLNEQPISMNELNGLKEFLKDALPARNPSSK